MKNESQQPSVARRKPPDPSIICVVRSLDPCARTAGRAYFVAGATARDLILVSVHGLRPGRATGDIDFGIAVESWEQFADLKGRLIATGEFSADHRALQRLIYTDQAAGFSIPVDLIPLRGVTSADGAIEWPPSLDIVVNVAGFEEALAFLRPDRVGGGPSGVRGLNTRLNLAETDRLGGPRQSKQQTGS